MQTNLNNSVLVRHPRQTGQYSGTEFTQQLYYQQENMVAASELVDLQNDMCEENNRLR